MDVLSPTIPNGTSNVAILEPVDSLTVLEHIANLIETTLGVARRELEAVGSLLSKSSRSDSLAKCARFAIEPSVTLYAQKDVREDLVNGHDDTPSQSKGKPPDPGLTLIQKLNMSTHSPPNYPPPQPHSHRLPSSNYPVH
jgi:dynein heavy chain 1